MEQATPPPPSPSPNGNILLLGSNWRPDTKLSFNRTASIRLQKDVMSVDPSQTRRPGCTAQLDTTALGRARWDRTETASAQRADSMTLLQWDRKEA